MSSRRIKVAVSDSLRSMGSNLSEALKDDFVAEHTRKIASTDFTGTCHDLKVGIRTTFTVESAADDEITGVKNIRTGLDLLRVCEMVSVALLDLDGSSYGKSDYGDGRHSYVLENVQFDPSSCSWKASAKFKSDQLVKSVTNRVVERRFEGTLPILVSCTAVLITDGDVQQSEMDDIIDGDSLSDMNPDDPLLGLFCSKHHSLDVSIDLSSVEIEDREKKNQKNQNIKNAMSMTLNCISHDISKQLDKHTLPDFPEGGYKRDLKFRKIYQLNAKIKSGAFGTVCLGTHRASGKKVAIKCIQKRKLSPHEDCAIFGEVSLLASIDHDQICGVIDFFDEDDWYYIIMPLMDGGDLFDRIGKLNNYSEDVARNLVFELLRTVAYLHENNIVHCDLKPKNLLLKSKDNDSSVVIADFGFATRVYSPNSVNKQCGTPYFVAPEIVLGDGYDTKVDMWSIGVILFSLLSGSLPFNGRRHIDLYKKIMAAQYNFDEEIWEDISDDAKDLVRKLLVVDPSERFSAQDALNHKWIRAESRMLRRNALRRSSVRMRTFNARLKFKTTILATHSMFRWKSVTRLGLALKKEESDSDLEEKFEQY